MTCIVAIKDVENKMTWIGGDSLGSNGSFKISRKDKKVFKFKNTNIIAGFTTSFRMGNILTYSGNLLSESDYLDHESMVVKFVPKLIQLFGQTGFQTNNSGEVRGGTFLIAQEDRLFKIESNYQVAENFCNYDSCGCGFEVALGSLHTTENMNLTPVERIHLALKASAEFIPGVQGPFFVINTKNDEVMELK